MDAVIEALQADIHRAFEPHDEPHGQQASPADCRRDEQASPADLAMRRDSARSPNTGAAQQVVSCAVVEMHRTDTEPQASRSTSVWC